MPKYSDYKVFNHYLYFTSHCIVEAMYVHIKKHYMSMYAKWARMSKQGFFVGK